MAGFTYSIDQNNARSTVMTAPLDLAEQRRPAGS